ncbi:MAG: DUF177 domain-containing protein [Acidimicrobiia bacterium]|nr:DUF177 domain-containing protein [Acidimicrobiia bacterium]
MTRSPFVIPIGDLLRDRAEPRDVDVEASVDWHVELSAVLPEPPLTAALTLSPMPGGLLVRGSVSGVARHSCHRCLEDYDEPFSVSVAELFVRPDDATEDDYTIDGDQLDLEPLLRDDVLLAMPMLPTCADCGELVDTSQTDLNTDVPEAGDSRSPFAVLKDLFEPGQ